MPCDARPHVAKRAEANPIAHHLANAILYKHTTTLPGASGAQVGAAVLSQHIMQPSHTHVHHLGAPRTHLQAVATAATAKKARSTHAIAEKGRPRMRLPKLCPSNRHESSTTLGKSTYTSARDDASDLNEQTVGTRSRLTARHAGAHSSHMTADANPESIPQ